MENIININEYVRLDDGIIGKVIPYDNGIKIRITEIDTWKPTIESIKKHSPNIIDLIEVGDYVNGQLVDEKWYDYANKEMRFYNNGNLIGLEGYIKSICTKEQFANAEYRLED